MRNTSPKIPVMGFIERSITTKIGYYVPLMIFTSIATTTVKFMTTFTPGISHESRIGWQVLCGLGLGAARQVGGLAVQAVLPKSDVAIGTAAIFFAQGLGGVVSISVAQNLFINSLAPGLAHIPGRDVKSVLDTGATDLRTSIFPQYFSAFLVVYNHALSKTFVLATTLAALSTIGTLSMEWKSVKVMQKRSPQRSEKNNDTV